MTDETGRARSARVHDEDYDVCGYEGYNEPDGYLDDAIENLGRRVGAEKPAQGKKHDAGKLRLDLVPPSTILGIGRVLTFGAEKYGERNWERGIDWGRVYAAALRHLVAWWDGEDYDGETGFSHLEHALCCISFLNEFRSTHRELDNRPGLGAP